MRPAGSSLAWLTRWRGTDEIPAEGNEAVDQGKCWIPEDVRGGVTPSGQDGPDMEHTPASSTIGGRIVPIAPTPRASWVAHPAVRTLRPSPPTAFTIDCADCEHQSTSVCDDCVVSFIVDRHPEDAVVVDADEARAVRLLEQAGLVPGVRHSRRVG